MLIFLDKLVVHLIILCLAYIIFKIITHFEMPSNLIDFLFQLNDDELMIISVNMLMLAVIVMTYDLTRYVFFFFLFC